MPEFNLAFHTTMVGLSFIPKILWLLWQINKLHPSKMISIFLEGFLTPQEAKEASPRSSINLTLIVIIIVGLGYLFGALFQKPSEMMYDRDRSFFFGIVKSDDFVKMKTYLEFLQGNLEVRFPERHEDQLNKIIEFRLSLLPEKKQWKIENANGFDSKDLSPSDLGKCYKRKNDYVGMISKLELKKEVLDEEKKQNLLCSALYAVKAIYSYQRYNVLATEIGYNKLDTIRKETITLRGLGFSAGFAFLIAVVILIIMIVLMFRSSGSIKDTFVPSSVGAASAALVFLVGSAVEDLESDYDEAVIALYQANYYSGQFKIKTSKEIVRLDLNDQLEFNMIVEAKKGTHQKYKINRSTGLLLLAEIKKTDCGYEWNYGAAPETVSGDRNLLDVILISDESYNPGSVIRVRALGVVKVNRDGQADDKLIAAPIEGTASDIDVKASSLKDWFEKCETADGMQVKIMTLADREKEIKQKLNYSRFLPRDSDALSSFGAK